MIPGMSKKMKVFAQAKKQSIEIITKWKDSYFLQTGSEKFY